jgi:hypothetical protein
LAPELVCQEDLVRMAVRVTVQVRFRPSHFSKALPDDLVDGKSIIIKRSKT